MKTLEQNNELLDQKLTEIKSLETEKSLLDDKIKKERQEVIDILDKEEIKQYKNNVATISYTERKFVKYDDKDKVLNELVEKNLPKYFDIIPEHKEINRDFEKDIKSGVFKIKGVDVETKQFPQIRFVKT